MRSNQPRHVRPERASPAPAPRSHRAPPESVGVTADLRHRFAQFRRTHAPRTRIPDDLRQAVLDALDQGSSMPVLRRELGLTAKQVADWVRHRPLPSPEMAASAPPSPTAHVFAVTDTPSGSEQSAAPADAPDALELRLGTWSIVIRSSCP